MTTSLKSITEAYKKNPEIFKDFCLLKFQNKVSDYVLYRYAQIYCQKLFNDNNAVLIKSGFLSVVTVNYNNVEGLKRTIESVLGQSLRRNTQLIVVDGGSTDGSLEYLATVEDKIDICVFGKDKNVYDAMNRGISLSTMGFTIFMNSGDVFYTKETVKEVYREVKKSKDLDVYYGGVSFNGNFESQPLDISNIWKGMVCSHQSMFFKTTLIKKYNYSIENTIASDYELIYQLYTLEKKFKLLNFIISLVEPVGISSDFETRTFERWMIVRKYNSPKIEINKINEFYKGLLSTKGEWVNPQKFNVNSNREIPRANVESRLIFLISMPRSGSTLLQKILDQSDDIATAGEPWVALPILSLYNEELIEAKYNQGLNVQAKNEFLKEIGNDFTIDMAQRAYLDSLYTTVLNSFKKRFFLDKTPRYVYIAEELERIYPNAKFIILLRNPASIISSYAETWKNGDYKKVLEDKNYTYDFTEGFKKLAYFSERKSSNKHIVRYENLLLSPEEEGKKIFKFLSLPFNQKYLEYGSGGGKKYAFGDPSSVYTKSKPDSTHIDKWLKALTSKYKIKYLLEALDLIEEKTFLALQYDRKIILDKINLIRPRSVLPSFDELNKYLGGDRKGATTEEAIDMTVGVVITCFNNEFTIGQTLNSVINQTLKPRHIIIADDASSDSSMDIVKSIISSTNIKITISSNVKNVGVSKNRDLAIRLLDTDYITTLDGDDMFAPNKIKNEVLSLHGSLERVAFSDTLVLEGESINRLDSSSYDSLSVDDMLLSIISRRIPVPRDMLIPKKLYEISFGFDHGFNLYEDWALKMRLMFYAGDFGWVHSGGVGTVYDRRSPGLSKKSNVILAYGQFLAISRNIDILSPSKELVIGGLKTVESLLSSKLQGRFEDLIKGINRFGVTKELYIRLKEVWSSRNLELKTHDIATILWKFSKPIIASDSLPLSENTYLTANPTRVFICTPVLNAVNTINRAIESVIFQEGNFEIIYHIQDAGSTDGTLDVLKKWKHKLENNQVEIKCLSIKFSYLSESDNGMYDAIYKTFTNFELRDKDWLAWINGDDYFEKKAFFFLEKIDGQFASKVQWVTGRTAVKNEQGNLNSFLSPTNKNAINFGVCDGQYFNYLQQEGTFFRSVLWQRVNHDRQFLNYKLAGDWSLWKEFSRYEEIYIVDSILGVFCRTEGQLSSVYENEYKSDIDKNISLNDRRVNFQNFPVCAMDMYVLVNCPGKNLLELQNKSIFGFYTTVQKKTINGYQLKAGQ